MASQSSVVVRLGSRTLLRVPLLLDVRLNISRECWEIALCTIVAFWRVELQIPDLVSEPLEKLCLQCGEGSSVDRRVDFEVARMSPKVGAPVRDERGAPLFLRHRPGQQTVNDNPVAKIFTPRRSRTSTRHSTSLRLPPSQLGQEADPSSSCSGFGSGRELGDLRKPRGAAG